MSDVKRRLSVIFQNFQTGHHFEVWASTLTGSATESLASPIPYNFELLIEAVD